MNALPVVGFSLLFLAAALFTAGNPAIGALPRGAATLYGIAAALAGVLAWANFGASLAARPPATARCPYARGRLRRSRRPARPRRPTRCPRLGLVGRQARRA